MKDNEIMLINSLGKNRFLREVLFWVIVFLLIVMEDLFDSELLNPKKLIQLISQLITSIIIVQFNLRILLPRLWHRNKKRYYIIVMPLSTIIYTLIVVLTFQRLSNDSSNIQESMDLFGYILALYFTLISISTLYHYNFKYIHLKDQQLTLQKMENEKNIAELSFLKYQLNPHFLFNTLNNIYSYSLENSPELPTMILNLSELTSYMLHDSQVEKISIEKEVEFLKSYIQLEQLRLDNNVKISFTVDDIPANLQIPPLIFIPIIENIFKHGLKEQSENDYADIHLSYEKGFLKLYVENTYSRQYEESTITSHIGQKNLKRRLELLYEDFELNISDKESIYSVLLKIPEVL